jgi:hypothetical protein
MLLLDSLNSPTDADSGDVRCDAGTRTVVCWINPTPRSEGVQQITTPHPFIAWRNMELAMFNGDLVRFVFNCFK